MHKLNLQSAVPVERALDYLVGKLTEIGKSNGWKYEDSGVGIGNDGNTWLYIAGSKDNGGALLSGPLYYVNPHCRFDNKALSPAWGEWKKGTWTQMGETNHITIIPKREPLNDEQIKEVQRELGILRYMGYGRIKESFLHNQKRLNI